MFGIVPSDAVLKQWKDKFDGRMMTSAVDEYCPEEFGILIQAVAILKTKVEMLEAQIRQDKEADRETTPES
jgi:hypothetical protein